MTKTIVLLFLSVVILACEPSDSPKIVTVCGSVYDKKIHEVVFHNLVDISLTNQTHEFIAKVDPCLRFTIDIPIKGLTHGRLMVGNYSQDLCLIPGNELFLTIKKHRIIFKGCGGQKNNFLCAMGIKGVHDNHFRKMADKCVLEPDEFLNDLNALKKERIDLWNNFKKDRNVDEKFCAYFRVNNEVLYQQQLRRFKKRYVNNHPDKAYSVAWPNEYLQADYLSYSTDDAFILSQDYIPNISEMVERKADLLNASLSNKKTLKGIVYQIMCDSLPPKTRESLMAYRFANTLKHYSLDSTKNKSNEALNYDELCAESGRNTQFTFNERRKGRMNPIY